MPNGQELLAQLDKEPLEQRARELLQDFKAFSPHPTNYKTEGGTGPYPAASDFNPGAYIIVQADIVNPGGPTVAEAKTPVNRADSNMFWRIGREDIVINELLHPVDVRLRNTDLLNNFRFPQRITVREFTHPKLGTWPISILREHIETTPVGSLHLVNKGVFSRENVLHIAELIDYLQAIGTRFAPRHEFHHTYMSYCPDAGLDKDGKPLFKWTRDIMGRDPEYRRLMEGNEFADGLHRLVDPDDLAMLFIGEKKLAFGNLIPLNWGFDEHHILTMKTTERTNATEAEVDRVTMLASLGSDLPRYNDFLQASLGPKPTHRRYELMRRGYLLDRFGNWIALKTEYDNAIKIGNEQIKAQLEQTVRDMLDLGYQALNKTGFWNESNFNFVDEPLGLKY